jgi:hypothetical protein
MFQIEGGAAISSRSGEEKLCCAILISSGMAAVRDASA